MTKKQDAIVRIALKVVVETVGLEITLDEIVDDFIALKEDQENVEFKEWD